MGWIAEERGGPGGAGMNVSMAHDSGGGAVTRSEGLGGRRVDYTGTQLASFLCRRELQDTA